MDILDKLEDDIVLQSIKNIKTANDADLPLVNKVAFMDLELIILTIMKERQAAVFGKHKKNKVNLGKENE